MDILNILSESESLYNKQFKDTAVLRANGVWLFFDNFTADSPLLSSQVIPWHLFTLRYLLLNESAYNFEPGPRLHMICLSYISHKGKSHFRRATLYTEQANRLFRDDLITHV